MKEGKETQQANKEFTGECEVLIGAVGDALYAIGGKWKLMIIIAIARGNNRFTELQRRVKGISARVLSSELKEMELNGFIVKKVSVGYPVLIEYELTPYSHTLEKVVAALTEWGLQHRQKIKDELSATGASPS